MKVNDETLSAFLDAELPEAEMNAVRERLKVDEELSDRLAQLAMVDQHLSNRYSTIDDHPMPDAVTRLLKQADDPENDERGGQDNLIEFPWWRSVQQSIRSQAGLAVAASLVMAIGAVQLWSSGVDDGWPAVANALETQPSGAAHELGDGRTLLARLTFTNQSGDYCRQFQLRSEESVSENIACKENQGWSLSAQEGVEDTSGGSGYRTASGGSVLDQTLDSMMQGQALGPEAERRLLESGWTGQ